MFEGFRLSTVDTAQASIRVGHSGSGPPLLLLHGSPQTMPCGTASPRASLKPSR